MTRADVAVKRLNRGQQAFNGHKITYRRGNDSITKLAAVRGNTRHDDYGDEQNSITGREQDWIIWVDDLVKEGTRWTPQAEDEIDWVDSTNTLRTFHVLPRLGDRCFRHTDQTVQQFRVYTIESLPNAE